MATLEQSKQIHDYIIVTEWSYNSNPKNFTWSKIMYTESLFAALLTLLVLFDSKLSWVSFNKADDANLKCVCLLIYYKNWLFKIDFNQIQPKTQWDDSQCFVESQHPYHKTNIRLKCLWRLQCSGHYCHVL